MTWPTDTVRPDALLTAARIMDKRMARIHELSEHNHQLKDQITRLQNAVRSYMNRSGEQDHLLVSRTWLRPTDLDPIE